MFIYEEDLDLIASIKKGDTICVKDKVIVPHNSWYTTFRRTWRESRKDTLEFIKNTIDKVINNKYIDKEIIIKKLSDVINGIRELQYTYENDNVTVNNLNTIIDTIKKYIDSHESNKGIYYNPILIAFNKKKLNKIFIK